MTRRRRPTFTDWQQHLLDELAQLASDASLGIKITAKPRLDGRGHAEVDIRLDTSSIPVAAGGLPLTEAEDFTVGIPPSVFALPHVGVGHRRFLGYPHVLQGTRLCIYLDPSREWQPPEGMAGFLNRLWGWLTDAAAGLFDASTAMYHAVGGVIHVTSGAPTVVVRGEVPEKSKPAYVLERSQSRLDLTYRNDVGGRRAPVIRLSAGLPMGGDRRLGVLLDILDDPYLDKSADRPVRVLPQSTGFLRRLLASAVRNPEGSMQYFVLAVPHPDGGPHHLLGGRLSARSADKLRAVAANRGVANFDPKEIDRSSAIEWCPMSDERPQVTTRRDDARPVAGLLGKNVHVWGCGGLGSWIAEFIARAGASSITVCDPGSITGGLLVRQNYCEADVGRMKAEALSDRLKAIRDDLTVATELGAVPNDPESVLSADLLVDATVNNSIVAYMDALSTDVGRRGLIAQVATDARSGTLGLANICAVGCRLTPSGIDQKSGEFVLSRAELEAYHGLWNSDPDGADELIPTRGCSVPTFHGSSADMAGVAATLVNLIGGHLLTADAAATSGTHLIALPQAGCEPAHFFALVDGNGDMVSDEPPVAA